MNALGIAVAFLLVQPAFWLGHVLPLLILGAIGGVLGRWLLAPRRKT